MKELNKYIGTGSDPFIIYNNTVIYKYYNGNPTYYNIGYISNWNYDRFKTIHFEDLGEKMQSEIIRNIIKYTNFKVPINFKIHKKGKDFKSHNLISL